MCTCPHAWWVYAQSAVMTCCFLMNPVCSASMESKSEEIDAICLPESSSPPLSALNSPSRNSKVEKLAGLAGTVPLAFLAAAQGAPSKNAGKSGCRSSVPPNSRSGCVVVLIHPSAGTYIPTERARPEGNQGTAASVRCGFEKLINVVPRCRFLFVYVYGT